MKKKTKEFIKDSMALGVLVGCLLAIILGAVVYGFGSDYSKPAIFDSRTMLAALGGFILGFPLSMQMVWKINRNAAEKRRRRKMLQELKLLRL